jgi:hypothetical protein
MNYITKKEARIVREWFEDFAVGTGIFFLGLVGLAILLGALWYGIFFAFQIHPLLGLASLLLGISGLVGAMFASERQ